jgi:hypothetical protein
MLQTLFRPEHQLRPCKTPTGPFECRSPRIKANLNWHPPFPHDSEPQSQLSNVENLPATVRFIVDRHFKSSITTLAIETPFRLANQ